jgi:endonuclease G, mitochondrial
MKKKSVLKLFYIFSVFLIFSSCRKNESEQNIYNSNTDIEEKTKTVLEFDFLPKSTTGQVITHDFYALSYNEKYEQAEWVAYKLTKKQLGHSNFNRPFFIEDRLVKTHSADWKNYKNSGYDKGHLCPAGDMRFSKKAYDDTFFTSNISPQLHDFNDGIWNRLEQKVRYWVSKYDTVYVITGGVLEDDLETIGREDVAVPKFFYKVLACTINGKTKMIGFLMPHEDSEKPLYEFVVPVDKIEQITHVNFFEKMDDKIENQLEKNMDYKDWSF